LYGEQGECEGDWSVAVAGGTRVRVLDTGSF